MRKLDFMIILAKHIYPEWSSTLVSPFGEI